MSVKKKIRYILELRFAPNLSSFLFNYETWARLRVIKLFLAAIDPNKNKRIIDVGAGNGRLELVLGRKDIYIYDNNEESIKEASLIFPNAKRGSGAKIEYEDNSFDWAISIHTLEHIPQDQRADFLLELVRVSSEGVFLNFPEGEFAKQLCINFLDALQKSGFEPNKWTIEHLQMGLPMVDEIMEILSRQSKFIFRYKFIRNFKSENSYWVKIRASKYMGIKYFLSPFISIIGYISRNKKPTVELVLVGTKKEEMAEGIIHKLQ